MRQIPAAHRILMTGTILQNNLDELWSLFNFTCPQLFPDQKRFHSDYARQIHTGSMKSASEASKHHSSTKAKDMRETIQPYFLRRLKADVFPEDGDGYKLPKKNDLTVWLTLTACQREFYKQVLKKKKVTDSSLAALTRLRQICNHPKMIAGTKMKADADRAESEDGESEDAASEVVGSDANVGSEDAGSDANVGLHNVSCKIDFIISLLGDLIPKGHHVLVFSQTRTMLDLIQESINSVSLKCTRIDGKMRSRLARYKIIKDFQAGIGAPILLLTKGVGGVGLNLTKADRVIIAEPSWNPSIDNQSIARVYRMGQNREVIAYRLIVC